MSTPPNESPAVMRHCSECERPILSRGLCSTHYKSHYRAGSLPAVPVRAAGGELNPVLKLMMPHQMMVAVQAEARRRGLKRVQPLIRKLLTFGLKRLDEVK